MNLHKIFDIGDRVDIVLKTRAGRVEYVTKLATIDNDTEIKVYTASVSRSAPILSSRNSYALTVYTNSCIYKFDAKFVKVEDLNGVSTWKFVLYSGGERIQRREHNRYPCTLSVEYSVAKSRAVQPSRAHYKGELIDLSVGGLKFKTNLELDIGDVIELYLPISTPSTVVTGIIKRSEDQYGRQDDNLVYSVQFTSDVENHKEPITKYVFGQQRKRLRRNDS